MQDFYAILVTGQYRLNGVLVSCPICSADRGLTFVTPLDLSAVNVRCPNKHIWADPRVPAHGIRDAAIAINQRASR